MQVANIAGRRGLDQGALGPPHMRPMTLKHRSLCPRLDRIFDKLPSREIEPASFGIADQCATLGAARDKVELSVRVCNSNPRAPYPRPRGQGSRSRPQVGVREKTAPSKFPPPPGADFTDVRYRTRLVLVACGFRVLPQRASEDACDADLFTISIYV